jgi:hypothetical protein
MPKSKFVKQAEAMNRLIDRWRSAKESGEMEYIGLNITKKEIRLEAEISGLYYAMYKTWKPVDQILKSWNTVTNTKPQMSSEF